MKLKPICVGSSLFLPLPIIFCRWQSSPLLLSFPSLVGFSSSLFISCGDNIVATTFLSLPT
jgi:hypothetical protein